MDNPLLLFCIFSERLGQAHPVDSLNLSLQSLKITHAG